MNDVNVRAQHSDADLAGGRCIPQYFMVVGKFGKIGTSRQIRSK